MQNMILAVITVNRSRMDGGAPIFYCADHQEMQQIGFTLEKIMDAMVHEVTADTLIIVRHK
jgi:hypothetical protein